MFPNYSQPLYRPPSEANSLIIQATLGCSFNQCSFCSMYRDKRYQQRPVESVLEDIQQASQQWPDTERVFLADGDALNLDTNDLLDILHGLKQVFPRLRRVSCYATPSNILHKSAEQLQRLRDNKLTLLYVGIESGSNTLLKKITKGASQRSIAESLHKAHAAGIKVSATVILGLGGKQYWQNHIDDTVALLNSAPVTYLSTLQLTIEGHQLSEFQAKFAEAFVKSDDMDILQEQYRLIKQLEPPQAVIFRSNHASNALALAATLPKDKEKLLLQLDQALSGKTAIRPEYLRGL